MPICDIFNQSGCEFFWNINGKVYSDINNNCLLDSIEPVNSEIKINLFNNGNLIQQTISNFEGGYIFETDTGAFTYSIDTTDLPITVTCPVSQFYSSIITTIDTIDLNMDFGLSCKPGFDVGVRAIVRDSGNFSPQFLSKLNFKAGDISNKYGLHCASGISGTVQIIINGDATYVSASPGSLIPVVNGDTLTYSIADFGMVNFNSDLKLLFKQTLLQQ